MRDAPEWARSLREKLADAGASPSTANQVVQVAEALAAYPARRAAAGALALAIVAQHPGRLSVRQAQRWMARAARLAPDVVQRAAKTRAGTTYSLVPLSGAGKPPAELTVFRREVFDAIAEILAEGDGPSEEAELAAELADVCGITSEWAARLLQQAARVDPRIVAWEDAAIDAHGRVRLARNYALVDFAGDGDD